MADPFSQKIYSSLKDTFDRAEKVASGVVEHSQEGLRMGEDAARHAWGEIQRLAHDFRLYFESDVFEADMDELSKRLRLTEEEYRVTAEDRRERVRQKLGALGRHAGKEVLEGMAKGGSLGAAVEASLGPFAKLVKTRRLVVPLTALLGGYEVALIAFHCYQIYSERKRASAAPSN